MTMQPAAVVPTRAPRRSRPSFTWPRVASTGRPGTSAVAAFPAFSARRAGLIHRTCLLRLALVAPLALGALVAHPARADDAPLAMAFGHLDHREVNCIACHHNFADDTGHGLCIDCHVRDAELRPLLEAQFHALCRGCHATERHAGHDAGPTRRCRDCHHAEDAP